MPNVKALIYAIKSITGGHRSMRSLIFEDQYNGSLSIDPEYDAAGIGLPSGAIAPVRYRRASVDLIKSAPMWMSGAQSTAGIFVYGFDGSVVSYNAAFTGETGVGNPGGTGNGMCVYNDYLYCSTGTDVYRYGRLSQTAPAFGQYWTVTLAMSALTNTTYPGTRNINYPNHVLHAHNDGYVYIADYDGANGRLRAFITDSDGTNGAATWQVLTLPPFMMPTSMCSYGTDLAILCVPQAPYTSGAIPKGATSILYLWDTIVGNKHYRAIDTGEPIASAVINKNGELYVTAGNIDVGTKLLKYLGGYSFSIESIVYEGSPPPTGAVDVSGNMIAWGNSVTYPATTAAVITNGYRDGRLPATAKNCIGRIDATGTLPIITSLKFLTRSAVPSFGWRTDTPAEYGITSLSGAGTITNNAIFVGPTFNIGRKFVIRRILIPLTGAVASTTTITPTIKVDDDTVSYTAGDAGLLAINNTNYVGSERLIDMRNLTIQGEHNFCLQLAFTGTDNIGADLPIEFEIERYD
jgi:hypothetical protein